MEQENDIKENTPLHIQEDDISNSMTCNYFKYDIIIDAIGFNHSNIITYLICGLLLMAEGCLLNIPILLGSVLQYQFKAQEYFKSVSFCLIFVGFAIGSLSFGKLTAMIGRKLLILICTVFFSIMACLSAIDNLYMFIISQFLCGVSIGMTFCIFNLVIEILPQKNRTKLMFGVFNFFKFGYLINVGITYWLNPTLDIHNKNTKWIILMSCIPIILCMICCFIFLKESPRYLIWMDKENEGIESLKTIAGYSNITITDNQVESIKNQITHSRLHDLQTSFTELFNSKYWLLTLSISIISLTQSICFFGSVYTLPILEEYEAKPNKKSAVLIHIIITVCASVALQIGNIFIIDLKYMGRRLVLVGTMSGALLILITFAFVHSYAFIFNIMIFYFLEANIYLLKLYTSEAYPTKIRDYGYSFLNFNTRIAACVMPFVVTPLERSIKYGSIYLFSVSALIGLIVTFGLQVETKDKHLDEVIEN